MKNKGKEKTNVPPQKLRRRSPTEGEAWKRGPYKAEFDRKQTFALEINPKERRPPSTALFGLIVKKGFSKLYNNQEISDVTLVLGSERIPAHKTVLCVWSDTFRGMLDSTSSWRESSMEELFVDIEPEAHEAFKLMLNYMYTGDTSLINSSNVFPLLVLTNYYGIHSLKEICGQMLRVIVDYDNLFCFLDVSENFDVKCLKTACCEHLANHFMAILEGDKLMNVKPSSLQEILQLDSLKIRSEKTVFEALLRYANQFTGEPEIRDHVLTTILPFVRFPDMPAGYLIEKVEGEQSIQHLPIVRDLVHEALKYKLYPRCIPADCIRIRSRSGFHFMEDSPLVSIAVSHEGKTLTCLAPATTSIKTNEMFMPWRDSVHFKIVDSISTTMIGMVSGHLFLSGYPGQHRNGWSYHRHGPIYHNSSSSFIGPLFSAGDKISIKIDFDLKTASFYKNNQFVFTVPDIPTSDLYPVVTTSAAGDSVEILEE